VDFLSLISSGVVIFASTNIDDIFVLMLFFADRSFRPWQIVTGQYIGIGVLVGVSMAVALAALAVPANLIGLLGLLPIAIGIKQLLDLRQKTVEETGMPAQPAFQGKSRLKFLSVVGVAVANGGDNIGVYVPLFATSTTEELTALIGVFAVMVSVWCMAGYWLVSHVVIGATLRRVGDRLLPFVLIGLGIYILGEAFL
jgi:cadmium resistance protein CadD (predicted permease)